MAEKIIHCFWAGGPKTKLAKKCRASWEKFAPEWEIREWSLEDIHRVHKETGRLPEFVTGAIAAKKWAVVSDWMRMKALYEEGGVYLDYDVELIRPFTPPEGEWVASEWTANGGTWMNPGSGIALAKGSPIAKHMLEAYESTAFDPKREMMVWINERLKEAGKLTILPPEEMSAIDLSGRRHITEKTLAIHHYAMSGSSKLRRVARWMSWHGMRWVVELLLRVRSKCR